MGNDNRALGVERWREYCVPMLVNASGLNDSKRWDTGSRVALDRFPFWRIRVRVDICRFGSADLDLHMLCGKETPAGPNRFESPQLLGEEDSINCVAS
jgi:hypothetical protein